MEQELSDMKGQLEREREQLMSLQEQAARAEKTVPAAAAAAESLRAAESQRAAESPPARSKAGYSMSVPAAAGVGILIAALAGLYIKFRRPPPALRHARGTGNATTADATP